MSERVDHGPDVTGLLLGEHARFRQNMADLEHEHDAFARREAFEALARNLAQHEAAEEVTVYPVIAQLDGGSALRREALRQEREIAARLARALRRLVWRPSSQKTRRLIDEFSSVLDAHLAFEETSLIPAIAALEHEHKRQMLGAWAQRAETLAPTRPHPHGPQHLPGLLTVGVALGLIDRLRDVGRDHARAKGPRRSRRSKPMARRTRRTRAGRWITWR